MRRAVVAVAAVLAFAATAAPAAAYYRSGSTTTVQAVVGTLPAPVPAADPADPGSLLWRVPAEVAAIQLEGRTGGAWVPLGAPVRCGRADRGFRLCSTTTTSGSTPTIASTAVPTAVPTPGGTTVDQHGNRYRTRSVAGSWFSEPSTEVGS